MESADYEAFVEELAEQKRRQQQGRDEAKKKNAETKKEAKPKMTEVEKLEAERKRLAEANKENTRKLKAAKARQARKEAKAREEAEKAEAVAFLRFCKQHKVNFGSGENQTWKYAYDWLAKWFEEWKTAEGNDGAPGRAQ